MLMVEKICSGGRGRGEGAESLPWSPDPSQMVGAASAVSSGPPDKHSRSTYYAPDVPLFYPCVPTAHFLMVNSMER